MRVHHAGQNELAFGIDDLGAVRRWDRRRDAFDRLAANQNVGHCRLMDVAVVVVNAAAADQVTGCITRHTDLPFQSGRPERIISTNFIGVSGTWPIRTLNGVSASSTAEISAAAAGIVPASPTPLTPSGLSGDGVSL